MAAQPAWSRGLLTWSLVAAGTAMFLVGRGTGGDGSSKLVGPPVPATTSTTTVPPVEGPEPVAFGVATPSGPHNLDELDAFEGAAGKIPGIFMFSQDWASGEFRPELLEAVRRRQMLPLVTWEPRDYRQQSAGSQRPDQPDYALSRILRGDFDAYITSWATGIRDLGYPVALRFGQQMNGSWFPWAEGVNGNRPGEYVAAWKHVRRLFAEVGATQVRWVWSVNISFAGSTPLGDLYPGDDYVDWVGVDGYNGGSDLPWGGWTAPEDLYLPTVREIRAFTQKPLIITEAGSTESGGSKAEWITSFFRMLENHSDIRGFVWVEANREADWRIVSSSAAKTAFRNGIAGSQFGRALPSVLNPVGR